MKIIVSCKTFCRAATWALSLVLANLAFAAAKNLGLTQQNPYGLVLLESTALQNFTIGFPTPLRFRSSLTLRVNVNEDNVVQILANVIHGE